MNKKYIVRLSAEEKTQLQDLIRKGKTQAYKIKDAGENFGPALREQTIPVRNHVVRTLPSYFDLSAFSPLQSKNIL